MALTYTQLDALTVNQTFLGRVRQAVAHHAAYWESDPTATQAQLNWCTAMFVGKKCGQTAADMMNELVQDATISGSTTGDGSDVTDAQLQTATDKICEKYWGS